MYKIIKMDCLKQEYERKIWDLLVMANKEFVPALSARKSSKQKRLDQTKTIITGEPLEYYNAIKTQNFLGVINKDNLLVGFMTYISGYDIEELGDINPTAYVTTVIVEKGHRNRGITTALYANLQQEVIESGLKHISTRTWSSNYSHIHILTKLGFAEVKLLKNHRGDGIHTIYYALNLEGENVLY